MSRAFNDFDDLIGKTILAIDINTAKDVISFKTLEGIFSYEAQGDCCSISWFEHFEGINFLIKEAVIKLEAREIASFCTEEKKRMSAGYLEKYGWAFFTKKGIAILEMRNDSNGYYGGYVKRIEPIEEAEGQWLSKDF